MFDTIVLITGDVEQPALASRLLEHNGGLLVAPVSTREELERIDRSVLQTCRIVSFVSEVIVPADVLHATGFGAYNFHPGSPDFPGWAPAAFAIDQRAPRFGATAHEMCERVDGGNIIDVEMFDVPPDTTFPEGDWRNDYFGGTRKAEVWEHVLALARDLELPVEDLPEVALRFCLSHPAVSTVIAGMRSLGNVDANAAAAGRGRLGERELEVLSAHRWDKNFYR